MKPTHSTWEELLKNMHVEVECEYGVGCTHYVIDPEKVNQAISQTLIQIKEEAMLLDAKTYRDLYRPEVQGEFAPTKEWGEICAEKDAYNKGVKKMLSIIQSHIDNQKHYSQNKEVL